MPERGGPAGAGVAPRLSQVLAPMWWWYPPALRNAAAGPSCAITSEAEHAAVELTVAGTPPRAGARAPYRSVGQPVEGSVAGSSSSPNRLSVSSGGVVIELGDWPSQSSRGRSA